MIVQLPQGTTSLVLRLDGSGTGADVVLQLASQADGPALASGPAPRRRTLLACAALGVVVGAVGLSFWNGPARSEGGAQHAASGGVERWERTKAGGRDAGRAGGTAGPSA